MGNGLKGPRQVTVITVSLNHKAGLEQTLESVAAQTCPDLEHIVVDGGSIDGSLDVLRAHRTEKEFSFVSEPDDGLYDAMNKGWQMANGELVVFMNSGDRFASDSVTEVCAEAHATEQWRWGYGCARVSDAGGRPLAILSFIPFRIDRLALGLSTVPHQATVMERELLRELGGFHVGAGIAADQELLLRAALTAPPRLWAEFFAEFEAGGLGSSRAPAAHVRDMGRFRNDLGLNVAGGRVPDKLTTIGLTLFKVAESYQKKARQHTHLYGRKLFDAR